MADDPDPFAHHPALRDRITDPLKSFFRSFRPKDVDAQMKAAGLPDDWRHSDETITTSHDAFFADRSDGDLWVFAYGSLMWDPAFRFAEVRRGRIDGYARRFCLKVTAARGSIEAPGLLAALDHGPGCEGLAFRIAADHAREETAILWRREMIAPGYNPVMARVDTDFGPVSALTFAADHAAQAIRTDLSREEQVRYIATGAGILGSSLQYIENLVAQLAVLGLDDPGVSALLSEARAHAAVCKV